MVISSESCLPNIINASNDQNSKNEVRQGPIKVQSFPQGKLKTKLFNVQQIELAPDQLAVLPNSTVYLGCGSFNHSDLEFKLQLRQILLFVRNINVRSNQNVCQSHALIVQITMTLGFSLHTGVREIYFLLHSELHALQREFVQNFHLGASKHSAKGV